MKRALGSWWFVSAAIALIAVALLCFGLPIFVAFLRPLWVKIGLFLLVVATWGTLAFLRVRKGKKRSEAIASELAQPNASDQESQVLASRMAEALATLRTASGKKRDYLYSRPWYIIIGPPGAGKTTALVNSGLRFPFSDQALKGVGGTRNLDFMFADEAVLVDTAGRYTSQDSDASADAQGWNRFLKLLKKHRPLQPINGVIVAIGVDELLRGDRRAIDAHAVAVRRRLAELRRTLEVQAPIYVLLTKADLLAGFVEYFDDLDVEGRRAVFGHTFGAGSERPSSAVLSQAFDGMARDVADRQAKRLTEEPDARRRALLLGFPSQLSSLRPRLLRFLDGAFAAEDGAGMLRGFYLTSGVQEGAPLDRIIAGMADVYDQPLQHAQSSGRAYFLNRLLGEVMFAEAGMVAADPAARKRQKSTLTAAMAGIAALAVLILGAWGLSFVKNRSFQVDLLAEAQAAQLLARDSGIDLVEVRDSDASLEQSLDTLNALRGLPGGYAERQAGGPPLSMRFGLYQSGLSKQAEESYREGLRRILLPRILLQIEDRLGSELANPLAIYEPLKVYLMLGGQGPMNTKAVSSWVNGFWMNEAYSGADRGPMRDQLKLHLAALLEDENMAAAWPARRAPLDGALINNARLAVQQMSLADRAYAILRSKAAASSGTPWNATRVLSSNDAQAFANGAEVLQLEVPYFFTRAGYEGAYQVGLATVQADLAKDLWVLGGDASTQSIREQLGSVRGGVASLYARDYIAAWDKVASVMQPADYFKNLAALAAITRTPSPLKLLLAEIKKNTTFPGGSGAARKMATEAAKARLGRTAQLLPQSQTMDAAQQIEAHFRPLHDYVGNGAAAPIDTLLEALKGASLALNQASITGGGLGAEAAQAATAQAIAAVNQAAAGAPGQLSNFVQSLAKGGGAAQISAASGAVTDDYAQRVMPLCRAVTQDRYPFFSASTNDLSSLDAQRVFGLGGIMDQFVSQRLAPILDTDGPVWRWREGDPVAATLDPATPDQFAKAGEVRALIANGLTVKVELVSLTGVDAVTFQAGDATYRFDAAARGPKPIRWSLQGGTPEASVVLHSGAEEVSRKTTEGIWALFKLMDLARRENAGPTAFLATFGDAAQAATFRIILPDERNPFSKGGMWTFRCPTTL